MRTERDRFADDVNRGVVGFRRIELRPQPQHGVRERVTIDQRTEVRPRGHLAIGIGEDCHDDAMAFDPVRIDRQRRLQVVERCREVRLHPCDSCRSPVPDLRRSLRTGGFAIGIGFFKTAELREHLRTEQSQFRECRRLLAVRLQFLDGPRQRRKCLLRFVAIPQRAEQRPHRGRERHVGPRRLPLEHP